jgi:hypothetical protein
MSVSRAPSPRPQGSNATSTATSAPPWGAAGAEMLLGASNAALKPVRARACVCMCVCCVCGVYMGFVHIRCSSTFKLLLLESEPSKQNNVSE